MKKITNKYYRKRVYNAVIASNACEYTICKKCPYRSQGCKNKLNKETGELLRDYLQMLHEMAASPAATSESDTTASATAPLV